MSYESALRTNLEALGYASLSVSEAIRSLRRLSAWMDERDVAARDLTPALFDEFLAVRWRSCGDVVSARRSVAVVRRFLREEGLLAAAEPTERTEVEVLLASFGDWLTSERGLAGETVRCYRSQAKTFLTALAEPVDETLAGLDAAAVTGFVLDHSAAAASVWSAKAQVTALRALLRFLHIQGLIPAPLVAAVPAVAGWRLSELPRRLPSDQVTALLAAQDLTSPVGLRDHAVLVTLARLGLRGAEIAALRLADVDWRAGEVVIRGKAGRVEALPLPAGVGEALAGYLTGGRPRCSSPMLFVTARAPFRALTPGAVRAIMGRACARAGLPRLGAHRLRHTLASDLLRAGSSLTEVGQILRHRNVASTMVYAKVDHIALRTLARPWPGGAR
jgi:site-specific recombinase XerD